MVKCEATLTEWQGVAVCEVCDWNENGSDGPHSADVHGGCEGRTCDGVSMCPECSAFFDEFGAMFDSKPAVRDGWEAIRDYCGPCLEDDGPCQGDGCGEWCTIQLSDRATRCRHGMDERQCVTCTGKRDPFGSYRKADGEGRYVKPYAELPATVRGSFGIGQVRAVITSGETETRQWTDAPSEGDWAGDEDTPVYVQRRAHRDDVVPLWYRVTVRGATPPWPNPDAYDRDAYLADHRERCEWGPVVRPT